MEHWSSPNAQTTALDRALGSGTMRSLGTGPLFDFHQTFVNSHAEPPRTSTHPLDTAKLLSHPDVPPVLRKPAHSKDESMSRVDAHSFGRRRDWADAEHRPHKPRVLVTTRNMARRETNQNVGVVEISAMTRSERIRLLEDMETGLERTDLDATPGVCLTARRAHQERLISRRVPLTSATQCIPQKTDGAMSTSLRTLNIKAAQTDPNYVEIDDGFSKAVDTYRAALRGTSACPETLDARHCANTIAPETSPSSPNRRQYPRPVPKPRKGRAVKRTVSEDDGKSEIERATACLAELAGVVERDNTKEVVHSTRIDQAVLFVKLSSQLKVCAYTLRPHDALRAAVLMAKSAALLETYERAASTTKYNADAYKIGMAFEDALTSVRSAMEAMLAAVSTRIIAADASYLGDAMLAMAETRAGRQEFLDAMLGHMLWLLAAKPRTFLPQVIARIVWALGWMSMEGGAEGGALAMSNDANTRAIAALQARLVDVLDDFLDEDIGTLAMDPAGGSLLSDVVLRRVLHRAGRLQVGLRPGSTRFLSAMQRLEASAQARLWEPFQAEIMPFMRDYCAHLSAANALQQEPMEKQNGGCIPPSLLNYSQQ